MGQRRRAEHQRRTYKDAPQHTAIILKPSMRIAIDIRKINEFGVGTYIWNLVRNLAAIDNRNEYLLIGSHRNFHELGPLPGNFMQLYQPEGAGRWRNHITIPFALRRRNVDVVHIPHHEAPLFHPSKLVVTVHDCVHLLFPQEDSTKFQKYWSYLRTKRVVENNLLLRLCRAVSGSVAASNC